MSYFCLSQSSFHEGVQEKAMVKLDTVKHHLQRLGDRSDWKYALGLHVRFANPTLVYQTYPQAWIDFYNDEGLVFVDPAVRWAMAQSGVCDWSDLAAADGAGVFGHAARFGLVYGKVVSVGDGASRSIGFFTRADRVIADDEIAQAAEILTALHDATDGVVGLPEDKLARLRALGPGLD
jgi:LuxR family transcriptional regulator